MSTFSSLRNVRAPLSRMLSQPATASAMRQKPAKPAPSTSASRWTEAWTEASNGVRRQRSSERSKQAMKAHVAPSAAVADTAATSRSTHASLSSQQRTPTSTTTVHRQSESWRPPAASSSPSSSSSSAQSSSFSSSHHYSPHPHTYPHHPHHPHPVNYTHLDLQLLQHQQPFAQQQTQTLINSTPWYQRAGMLGARHQPGTASTAARGPTSSTSSTSSSSTPSATLGPGQRFLISYHDLEQALERRGLRSVRVVLAAVFGLAAAIGLAWPKIKQWGAVEGAEVAAASLEDEQLQAKINGMVQNVLNDEATLQHVESLLKKAVTNLLHDEEFTATSVEWTGEVLYNAILQDALIERGTEYVAEVFGRDDSVSAAESLMADAVKRTVSDEVVQDSVASGFWSSIRASVVGRRRERPTQDAKQSGAEGKSDADKQVSPSANAGQAAVGTSPASASAIIEGPEASNRSSDSGKTESGSGQPPLTSTSVSSSRS